jgi:hypothetical protein
MVQSGCCSDGLGSISVHADLRLMKKRCLFSIDTAGSPTAEGLESLMLEILLDAKSLHFTQILNAAGKKNGLTSELILHASPLANRTKHSGPISFTRPTFNVFIFAPLDDCK